MYSKMTIGDRMKEYYENITKYFLPRRTNTIIRIDGKAFHTYTKGLERPFDYFLIDDMNETAKFLCNEIQGAKLAYVQSDEISILVTDFDKLATSAWFGGSIQKMASVSASLATGAFNKRRFKRGIDKTAFFDSRVFTIPAKTEVVNYFIWRQEDCLRNSVSSVAQSLFSHRELNGKNTKQMKEMCLDRGIDWDSYEDRVKQGRLIIKTEYETDGPNPVTRSRWTTIGAPLFREDKSIFSEIYDELQFAK